jgi:ATP-dependent Clp protease protease subunit
MAFTILSPTSKRTRAQTGGSGTARLLIYDVIGGGDWFGDGGTTAKTVATWLDGLNHPANIEIRINSPGGDVFEGITIYNRLANFPVPVDVFVDGAAWSIASVIAMAGDTVTLAENASVMIHNPYSFDIGDAVEKRKVADQLDTIKVNLIDAYQRHSSSGRQRLSDLMDQETWFTASEALDVGLATRIEETALPIAACAPGFLKYRNMPDWARAVGAPRPQFERRAARMAAFLKHK